MIGVKKKVRNLAHRQVREVATPDIGHVLADRAFAESILSHRRPEREDATGRNGK